MVSVGTKAFIHEPPKKQKTLGNHGKNCIVIGPAMQNYRELTFYVPNTRGIQNMDTYVFLPSKFELTVNEAANKATVALEEFTAAIKKPEIKQIIFETTTINKAINVLTDLSSPNQTTTTKYTAVALRMETDRHAQR